MVSCRPWIEAVTTMLFLALALIFGVFDSQAGILLACFTGMVFSARPNSAFLAIALVAVVLHPYVGAIFAAAYLLAYLTVDIAISRDQLATQRRAARSQGLG